VAQDAGIGRRTLQRAKVVETKGTEEEKEAVAKGKVTVSRAEKIIREKEADIRQAAKADPGRFADLVEKLDKKVAVDRVHKELRKREAEGTRKAHVMLDCEEQPVPSHLRDLFATPFLRDLSKMAEDMVREGITRIHARVKDNGHRFKWLLLGKILKTCESAEEDLKVLWSHLSEAIPHAVCPVCKGKSSETDDSPSCNGCRSTGYVPKHRFVELRKEGRK
jgi:hypothetical protein